MQEPTCFTYYDRKNGTYKKESRVREAFIPDNRYAPNLSIGQQFDQRSNKSIQESDELSGGAIGVIAFVIGCIFFPTVIGTGLGILIIMGIFALPFVVFYLLSLIAALAVSGIQDFEEYKRQGRF